MEVFYLLNTEIKLSEIRTEQENINANCNLKKMNYVCFKLYVYVLPTEPYSADRNFVFDRLTDELYPL